MAKASDQVKAGELEMESVGWLAKALAQGSEQGKAVE